MKTLPLFIFLSAALCVVTAQGASSDKMTPERRKAMAEAAGNPEFDTYSARKSGDWDSDIWHLSRAYYDDKLGEAQRGKRPGKNDVAQINGLGGITVRLNKPVEVLSYYHGRRDNHLVIGKDGVLKVNVRFEGQGGSDGSGSFTVENGGRLEVDTRFILAGKLQNHENAVGVFNQNGGVVTLSVPMHLTGHFTLTSSRTSTGIYNLNGGALNIVTPEGKPGGIANGVGKGVFNFNGGALNSTVLGLDLDNTKKGSLSPGGDGEVGKTTLVSNEPCTYTQGKNARFTVDIAGRSKYDQLVWTAKGKGGKVILEDGTTIWVQYAKNYKASSGATFDIIECDQLEVRGQLKIDGPAGRDFSYEVVNGRQQALRLKYGR